jgi:hypothetical protein
MTSSPEQLGGLSDPPEDRACHPVITSSPNTLMLSRLAHYPRQR